MNRGTVWVEPSAHQWILLRLICTMIIPASEKKKKNHRTQSVQYPINISSIHSSMSIVKALERERERESTWDFVAPKERNLSKKSAESLSKRWWWSWEMECDCKEERRGESKSLAQFWNLINFSFFLYFSSSFFSLFFSGDLPLKSPMVTHTHTQSKKSIFCSSFPLPWIKWSLTPHHTWSRAGRERENARSLVKRDFPALVESRRFGEQIKRGATSMIIWESYRNQRGVKFFSSSSSRRHGKGKALKAPHRRHQPKADHGQWSMMLELSLACPHEFHLFFSPAKHHLRFRPCGPWHPFLDQNI